MQLLPLLHGAGSLPCVEGAFRLFLGDTQGSCHTCLSGQPVPGHSWDI